MVASKNTPVSIAVEQNSAVSSKGLGCKPLELCGGFTRVDDSRGVNLLWV